MELYNSFTYIADLQVAIKQTLNMENLRNSSVMITGATGLIGSFLTDMLVMSGKNITVYAIGRSIERLRKRFDGINGKIVFIEHDVKEKLNFNFNVDYIIHAASNAYPAAFNNDPVGTIMSNIQGTKYLLDYGLVHNCKRFLYVSSGEVYGQGDLNLDSFAEGYSGYVDSMQFRSCYPNSKRAAETLCVSYTKQFALDTIIVRPCHTYGPTTNFKDNRANVQFVNHALAGKDIVLNSDGSQMRSYCYVADSASAILTVLLNGKSMEAYNIANCEVRKTIADFAEEVARQVGRRVIFSNPDEVTLTERSPIVKQILNTKKLESLGWHGSYGLEVGISHVLSIAKGR